MVVQSPVRFPEFLQPKCEEGGQRFSEFHVVASDVNVRAAVQYSTDVQYSTIEYRCSLLINIISHVSWLDLFHH